MDARRILTNGVLVLLSLIFLTVTAEARWGYVREPVFLEKKVGGPRDPVIDPEDYWFVNYEILMTEDLRHAYYAEPKSRLFRRICGQDTAYEFLKECAEEKKPERWNAWRMEERHRGEEIVDLKYGYFGNYELSGFDLSMCNLQGAYLAYADLSNVNFRGANLDEADLFFAKLNDAELSYTRLFRANLNGAELIRANLDGVDLAHTYLISADLSYTKLKEVNFEYYEIRSLSGVYSEYSFYYAQSDLDQIYLREQMSRAHRVRSLLGVKMIGADLSGVCLRGLDLRNADLSFANLSRADLGLANLSGARLDNADLRDANLSGANLWGASFFHADLRNADLSNVTAHEIEYLILTEGMRENALRQPAPEQMYILSELRTLESLFVHRLGYSMPSSSSVDLRGADLSGLRLEGVNLSGSNLDNANLSNTSMIGTSLESARVTFAIVNGRTLFSNCLVDRSTDFTGVALGDARMLPVMRNRLEDNIRRISWESWYRDSRTGFWDGLEKSIAHAFWLVSDHGSSTKRIIVCLFISSIIFAFAYVCLNCTTQEALFKKIRSPNECTLCKRETWIWFLQIYCFSLVSMFSIGFSQIDLFTTKTWHSKVMLALVILNNMVGYFLLVCFVTRLGVMFQALSP